MTQKPFRMSASVHDQLMAGLDGLSEVQKSQILSAIASLCAEVQMHCTHQALEHMRQEWANALAVMLRSGK